MDLRSKVLEAFSYNSTTGELYWSKDRPHSHFASLGSYKGYMTRFSGQRAGCVVSFGNVSYRQIRLNGVLYLEHQLVWLLENSEIVDLLDHRDGNGLNNTISNLRLADRVINGRNCLRKSNNTSGVTGVYRHKQNNNWVAEAHWTEDGKKCKKSLGSYDNLEDAKQAREAWMVGQGNFSERHGKEIK